jgi:hypothetical protein
MTTWDVSDISKGPFVIFVWLADIKHKHIASLYTRLRCSGVNLDDLGFSGSQ